MSRFLSKAMSGMSPYVPGEQPQDKKYIKLNTNECPYGPSLYVSQAINSFKADSLRLYPDPDARVLKKAGAEAFGLAEENVFCAGGSDEALAYAFMAFFDRGDTVVFPNITYGFYKVYADLLGLNAKEIPLAEDFTVNISDYFNSDGHIFIANPNAPTGICFDRGAIKEILRQNKDRLVVVDEAYADFSGGFSCVDMIKDYDNLMVVQTFSKSRALAGMRISLAFGCKELIDGLERVKYSFNPYNMDRISIDVAVAALKDRDYLGMITRKIIKTREWTADKLKELGFRVLPSSANFLFASPPSGNGGELYERLKDNGILVRHFSKPEISAFVRITIGTDVEMSTLINTITRIL